MPYKVTTTKIPDVLILEPSVYGDERGFFYESFNAHDFEKTTGITAAFVQDNHSQSSKNVLRGLHYQINRPQGKLVRVIEGEVFDVAVDLRRTAPTYGQWVGVELSATNNRQLWVPAGFAHGFLVTSDKAQFLYKTTDYWYPDLERSLLWSDSELGITWPIIDMPILTPKDAEAKKFVDVESY